MRLTFNQLLALDNILPEQVQLVRHRDTRLSSVATPYSLWVSDLQQFEFYQSIQGREVFRKEAGSLIASFVVTHAAETLFVGLYGVYGLGEVERGTFDPVSGQDVSGVHLYDLRPDPRLSSYVGKIVIDWGTGYRSWAQRAHKRDKEILEVRRQFREEQFPGFLEFETTLSKVAGLSPGWRQVLHASRGIYLLTSLKTREQYVGSATGEGGFQTRWEQHALKGGDAVKFKSKDPADYFVSILEVASSTDSTHDIQLAEQRWIRKLHSVDMGLNGNPGGQIMSNKQIGALAAFSPIFGAPDFSAGKMVLPPDEKPDVVHMSFPSYAVSVDAFIKMAYDRGWVLDNFSWSKWMSSEEATRLRDDPATLATATPEQLARLLTVLIRQERFADGALLAAFDSGLILGIVRRAAVLAGI